MRHGDAQQVASTCARRGSRPRRTPGTGRSRAGCRPGRAGCRLRAAHRPVDVLARAVDAGERLLVQQAGHAVLLRPRACSVSMISCWWSVARLAFSKIGAISYCAGATSLCRVLTGTPSLYSSRSVSSMQASTRSGIAPKYWSSNSWPFGGLAPNSVRPAVDQVGPGEVEVAVDQEVFLLGAGGGRDRAGVRVAEQLQDALGLLVQGLHRAQQRRLLVERLAGPRAERRRDAQRRAVGVFQDVGRAGRIPGGVAAGFERGADAARGEARRVRLALDQFLAGELGDRPAVAGRARESCRAFRRSGRSAARRRGRSGWRPFRWPSPSWPRRRRRRRWRRAFRRCLIVRCSAL